MYYTGPMYHTGPWDATGVDYTGTAATNTWKGTTSAVWDTTSATSGNWSNNSTGGTFTWVNQELQAVFDNTGSNRAITISGVAIAHGLTFNAGATGYSFTGGSLTVTAGGIQANENVTFNSPMYVGAPQTWTVADGKTLTLNNALHTIISDLTIDGNGSTIIAGPIDGGGVANIYGGAAPGNLIKNGTGTLTLSGASNYSGSITVSSGVLNFAPASGVVASYTGVIGGTGTGTIHKTDLGLLILAPAAGSNTYRASTSIDGGVLQADSGVGLPNTSFLILNGGVLQPNTSSAGTFSRGLAASGSNKFEWSSSGSGGFSAGAGSLTVNVGGSTTAGTLTWGSSVGTNIIGTLKFGSTTSQNVTIFRNPLNLNGATRTINVDDNPASAADYTIMQGAILNSTGTAGLIKTGNGLLALTSGSNNYNGTTTIAAGVLQENLPSTSFLSLEGGVYESASGGTFSRSLGSSGGTFRYTGNGGGFSTTSNPFTINVGGQTTPTTLVWGTSVGTQIVGNLSFGSVRSTSSLTFVNPVNLNGGARTIQVADNPNSTGDYTAFPGAISDSLGGGSLAKTARGRSTCKARRRTAIPAGRRSRARWWRRRRAGQSPFPAT